MANHHKGYDAERDALHWDCGRFLASRFCIFRCRALVFGGYRFFNPEPDQAADPQRIELTENDIQQLAISWLAQGRLQPSSDELRSLVDQKVTEEILSREAIALGFDQDDQIIKRRLAQKMDFLATDLAALEDPTDAQLADWYSKNSDRFALPPHAGFRHLLFLPGQTGKQRGARRCRGSACRAGRQLAVSTGA